MPGQSVWPRFDLRSHSFHHEGDIIRALSSEENKLMGAGPVMKDRERRLRRFPEKGEEVTTVQKRSPGRGAGSRLSLLDNFRRADVPQACEGHCLL